MPKVDEKFDLIDEFIKNSPKIKINNDYEVRSSFKTDQKIKDELITETLAKIYVNQEKFNKAIKAYEILSLKYPKKSSFFADQINDIKKLKSKE
jgi:phosphoserine phosphatase